MFEVIITSDDHTKEIWQPLCEDCMERIEGLAEDTGEDYETSEIHSTSCCSICGVREE